MATILKKDLSITQKAILIQIEKEWIQNPNWRFGQLLTNLGIIEIEESEISYRPPHSLRDIYYDSNIEVLERVGRKKVHRNAFDDIIPSSRTNLYRSFYKKLDELNSFLWKQQKLVEREFNKEFLKLDTLMKKPEEPLSDFEIWIDVEYFDKDADSPFHSIRLQDELNLIENDGESTLLRSNWDKETPVPKLSQPVCYLLHDFIDHQKSSRTWEENVLRLHTIWTDLKIWKQRVFHFDEKHQLIQMNSDSSLEEKSQKRSHDK